jgi:Flp pilus assembly protein TadD
MGLGRLYMNQFVYAERAPADARAKAFASLQKAADLDPSSGLTHAYLASAINQFDRDPARARRELEQALALEPANARVLVGAGNFASSIGRAEKAALLFARAAMLDPTNSGTFAGLQIAQYIHRDCASVVETGRKVLTLNPDSPEARSSNGLCLVRMGQAEEALAEFRAEPGPQPRMAGLAIAYNALGRKADAAAQLVQLQKEHPDDGAFYLATAHAQMGNVDAAFDALARAEKLEDAGLLLSAWDFLFEPLHKDPRWAAMLKRIGRSPEQLAAIDLKLPEFD